MCIPRNVTQDRRKGDGKKEGWDMKGKDGEEVPSLEGD